MVVIDIAPQHHSTTAPQHHSTTAPQHHSTTAPQHHSTTAPQHHSTTAPQHSLDLSFYTQYKFWKKQNSPPWKLQLSYAA
ncbi:hypothetical protein [Acinetobacter brisouii]